ncbi:MAG TPA: PEPxxWA-CTERM sorting domain-containing protein [Phenylobacterium sp.]
MNYKHLLISIVGAAALASSAHATVAYDADLIAPGVIYGTGNENGHFTVDTTDGVELGVRAHVHKQLATSPAGNLYSFALGDSISIDFSVHAFDFASLAGFTPLLTIHDLANNHIQSFNPGLIPDNAVSGPNAFQNSERLSFGFMDSLFNANQNNTFKITLSLAQAGGDLRSVTAVVKQGAGASGAVPEPAAWALMILGFGGVGVTLRRTRRTTALA